MQTEELLDELVRRVRESLGDDLVCVVLYGSAAAGDFQEKVSDLNTLCVLKQAGMAQLEAAYPAVDWWLKKRQPAPILLSTEEVQNAHDAFAIEFLDIRAAYRILWGEDVIKPVEVEPQHHRHQVEHELRSRLLRLRERFLALQKDRRELKSLMTASVPTFATLFRHALLLAGVEAPVRKREIFQQAAERFSLSAAPFLKLLDVREGKQKIEDAGLHPLFEDYLKQITAAAQQVDKL